MTVSKAAFVTVAMLFTMIIISTVISANSSSSNDTAFDGYGVSISEQ
ncbi:MULTISPECIES: hypothetical protein [unclassified Bartonella]|nr:MULTISPECIES: hypothetical protein [unclassified Bartonella]UXN02804.1 hypothetical protein N6B01_10025 [Bartonella sp. HY406]